MSQTSVTSQSTWRSKIKAMGPGILMASAAVGGSHIVSSTQAGGSYGWALLGWLFWLTSSNTHSSVLVLSIPQTQVKPLLKVMLRKVSSIFGYSLF